MNLREKLAALEHDQWAHWSKHLLNFLGLTTEWVDGTVEARFGAKHGDRVDTWWTQIETPYDQLSEIEKDSDREWADKVLEVVNEHLRYEQEMLIHRIMRYRKHVGGCLACGAPEPDLCLDDCPLKGIME
jgi:hypothetical protein